MDTKGYPSHLLDTLLEGSEKMTGTRMYLQYSPMEMHTSRGRGIFPKPYRARVNGY